MQKARKRTLYGKEFNHRNRLNSAIRMKNGGEGQFDVLKKIGCEPKPKMPPEAIFRQWGYVEATP